jgi:hypothetical protein
VGEWDKKKKNPVPLAREDRGRLRASFSSLDDYARMRRRPSVPPEGEAAAIDIRICMQCIEIMRARC